jgi:hypothetical protein
MLSWGINRLIHRAVVGLLVTTCLITGGIKEICAQSAVKLYPVRQGQLKLQVPAAWAEERQSSTPGGPLSLTFRPAPGGRFLIRAKISWDEKAVGNFNSDARLQEIAMAAGSQFLPRAVEKQLKLNDVRGDFLRGYYFVLTDKAPLSGDYEIMAQGAAALGEVLILFTYLGYPGGETELQRLIEALRSASLTTNPPQRP